MVSGLDVRAQQISDMFELSEEKQHWIIWFLGDGFNAVQSIGLRGVTQFLSAGGDLKTIEEMSCA